MAELPQLTQQDMAHHIDAEQIRAEIDKRYAEYRAKMKTDDFTYYEGMADALDLFEQYIDTFPEQPEADLEKEIDEWLKAGPITDTRYSDYCDDDIKETARHFYELGKNARKEDK